MTESNIAKALLKVQKDITNPVNTATNPFFKSKYAPLNDILNLVRPLLTRNGILMTQNIGTDDEGRPYVQTILIHESGEHLETDKLTVKLDKNSVQGVGSAITYIRRYQLSAMLGISSEDDDDANQVSPQPTSKPNGKSEPKTKTRPPKLEDKKPAQRKGPMAQAMDRADKKKKTDEPEVLQMPKDDDNNSELLNKIEGISKPLDRMFRNVANKEAITKEGILKGANNLLGESLTPEQMNEIRAALE